MTKVHLGFECAYYQPNEQGHSIVPGGPNQPALARSLHGGETMKILWAPVTFSLGMQGVYQELGRSIFDKGKTITPSAHKPYDHAMVFKIKERRLTDEAGELPGMYEDSSGGRKAGGRRADLGVAFPLLGSGGG